MPLYSYACQSCGAEFELLVSSGEEAACPECGSDDLNRLLSRTVAPGGSKDFIQRARAQASKEGHFSNYSKAEKGKMKS